MKKRVFPKKSELRSEMELDVGVFLHGHLEGVGRLGKEIYPPPEFLLNLSIFNILERFFIPFPLFCGCKITKKNRNEKQEIWQ